MSDDVVLSRGVALLAAALLSVWMVAWIPAPAQAGILCSTLNVCGHAHNSTASTHWLRVRCSSGLSWVRVGRWNHCRDVNAVYARRGQVTWWYKAGGWVRLANGRHNIHDGQWFRYKVRG